MCTCIRLVPNIYALTAPAFAQPEVITLDSDSKSEDGSNISILDVSSDSGGIIELDLDLQNEDTIIQSDNDENVEPFQVL